MGVPSNPATDPRGDRWAIAPACGRSREPMTPLVGMRTFVLYCVVPWPVRDVRASLRLCTSSRPRS